jgi:hypothetical protein
MKYDVFLSYNRKDGQVAKEIKDALNNLGFNDVYFNPEARTSNIPELKDALRAEIDQSRRFVLLLGKNGLGETQKKEAEYALIILGGVFGDGHIEPPLGIH